MENNTPPAITDAQPNASEVKTLRATVRGRVQNVGFRMFALDVARSLGVSGYVRNEYDGSVHVVAVGPAEKLERLLSSLWRGPSHARVEHMDVDWLPGNPQSIEGTFEVRY